MHTQMAISKITITFTIHLKYHENSHEFRDVHEHFPTRAFVSEDFRYQREKERKT